MSNQEQLHNTARVEEFQRLFAGVRGVEIISGTTNGTANTEDAFAHTGGRIPRGFIVITQDKAGSVYAGTTANTTSAIYLKGSVVSIAFKAILVF